MATAVLMPKQGNTVEECVLTTWTKQVGDRVSTGDIIAEIETDKATFEVESTADGEILATFWEEGDLVPVLVNMCVVGEAGEDTEQFRPDGAESAETAEAAPAAEEAPAESAAPAAVAAQAVPAAAAPAAPAADNAPLSPRAKRFVAEHPFQVPSIQGSGAGGRIMEKDVMEAYQTAPKLSPVAAQMLAEGVAAPAAGSGVGGRILSGDMGKAAPAAGAVAPAEVAAEAPVAEVEVKKLSNIRKIIADRMLDSLSTTAQYTLTTDVDATGLLAFRKRIKAARETMDVGNINITDMVVYATIQALKLHPEANACFVNGEMHHYNAVHMAIACDTPRGLMVPVMFNSDKMTLRQVSETIKQYVTEANEGTINPDLLNGGTFTVSNVGSMGIKTFTPVLNKPQVAILGVGATELKPVRRNGEVVFVDHMHLSLTANHQVLDGAPGARFLKTLRSIIENFELYCLAS